MGLPFLASSRDKVLQDYEGHRGILAGLGDHRVHPVDFRDHRGIFRDFRNFGDERWTSREQMENSSCLKE